MARVFMGIGHGGNDPGAVANGLRESDINLNIGLACKAELERHGVIVGISRTRDENDDINEEVRECNAFKPDYAIDIHTNAGKGDGFEAYYHYKGGKGKELATKIEKEVIAIGQNSRGLKVKLNSAGQDYYSFIRNTICPGIILECAFIDSKDVEIIDTLEEQKRFGIAYAKGILAQLGIQYKPQVQPQPPVQAGNSGVYRIFADGVQQGTAYANIDNILKLVRENLEKGSKKIELIQK